MFFDLQIYSKSTSDMFYYKVGEALLQNGASLKYYKVG